MVREVNVMQALFTGGLGDFIGAESFMTEEEKDAVKVVMWATRNREEIRSAIDLKLIFPNMVEERIMFDDFCDDRPTRPWQEGDRFMNIGKKHELNLKCKLNLSQSDLDAISDHSLDATLDRIFSGQRQFQTSRFATRNILPDITHFNLPSRFIVIHPWSDAEINGREFNDADWQNIFTLLENVECTGVVVNRSSKYAPNHHRLIDLTNKTSLKETFAIIRQAEACVLCASSLACYATKLFPKNKIWLKGGWDHMFSDWATYFYHGPFTVPNDIIFRDFNILQHFRIKKIEQSGPLFNGPVTTQRDLDQGILSLI